MRRVALLVEYDGGAFRGPQRQENTPDTVQAVLESAAKAIGCPVPRFIAAGRTDAGVHAQGQVIVMDIPERLPAHRIALALNAYLSDAVRVRRAVECDPDFNPRLDARGRCYVYRLSAPGAPPPMYRGVVARSIYRLDPELTIAAANSFVGKRELREWRSSYCEGKRTLLTIDDADAWAPRVAEDDSTEPAPWWRIRFRARSFLHHQVRFMVGGIVAVGSGRLGLEELRAALGAGRRPTIVKCEPACGLCFERVEYPHDRNPFRKMPT